MPEKTRILIAEDEEPVRELLTDILADAGYDVRGVSTGEKALDEIGEENYTLLLTDLRMPGMNGIDLIREAKKIDENICVIVITGYPSVQSVVESMREGVSDYLAKPFDIKEIKLAVDRAVEKARHKESYRDLVVLDSLTGLYNYRRFHEVLPNEIERTKRYSQPFSLLMLDIDDFKKFNEANGHLAGDKLLADISKLFLAAIRKADTVFRYGREEFLIFLPHIGKSGASKAASRLLKLIKQRLSVTVSIGIVSCPEDASLGEELIGKLEAALHQAKQSGKNRVCLSAGKNDR